MPRLRNEESEQTQYKDGDVVWVKIHNTEIWWPGEVTSSQDFRYVNTNRPPFAVVAFFNEKTFEQVRSPKLICPFQCDHKEQFIQRGTKKAIGLHMKEKFADDVNIAECRLRRQTSVTTNSSLDVGLASSRPDSLIKALLSSSSSNRSSCTRDSITGSSITTTTATTTTTGQNEPTFRIMDIGSPSTSQERRCDTTNYDCNLCSFRTNSMSVLLIHRRVHLEQKPSKSGGHNSSSGNILSGHKQGSGHHGRAARRANTINLVDTRLHNISHHNQRSHHQHQHHLHQDNKSRSISTAKFLRNSLRCHSRHVSIQVEGVLSDKAQLMVASIAQRTMDSIERVVEPRDTDSSSSPMSFLDTRSSNKSHYHTNAAQISSRGPRHRRSNQLRATMPAPVPASPELAPGPSPSKQRRLTRSMSRRQQDVTPTTIPIDSPPIISNLSPPVTTTPRRSGNRRSTTNNRPRNLATTMTPPSVSTPKEQGSPAVEEVKVMKSKSTAKGTTRKRTRETSPVAKIESPKVVAPSTPEKPKHHEKIEARKVSSPAPAAAAVANTPARKNLPLKPASLELQMSLLAEWCDDETEEQWPSTGVTTATATTTTTTTTTIKQQPDKMTDSEPDPSEEQQQSVNKKLNLISEWADDDDEESKQETSTTTTTMTTSTTATSNGGESVDLNQEMSLATKKRIRNIPKKERRNVMAMQEEEADSNSNTNGGGDIKAAPTSDEPIIIQDSDASSNESVVFVDAEPRQRGKIAHSAAGASGATTTTSAAAIAAATPATSQQSSPSKGTAGNNNSSACCFDFEEDDEDELEQQRLQQQLLDGQNGLSYSRHRTAAKRQEKLLATNETVEMEENKAEPPDDLFKGFEEVLERAANAAEAEAEAELQLQLQQQQLEQQQQKDEGEEIEVETEADPHQQQQQQQQQLALPIKERQKRIFKSRNKSQLAASPPKEEEDSTIFENIRNQEQSEQQLQEEEQKIHENEAVSLCCFSHVSLQTHTNGGNSTSSSSICLVKQFDHSQGEVEAEAYTEIDKSSKRSSKSKTEERPQHQRLKSKSKCKGKAKGKGKAKAKTKTKLKLASSPPPPPPLPETIFSIPTPTPEAEELSNNNSNSSSTSNCSGIVSPVLSYSTSCSVASNIAVISAEEARELQRSASDAGLDPATIVDATQPMQRGGVLILEDIRLPNLYQPITQSFSDSNDSHKQQVEKVLHLEQEPIIEENETDQQPEALQLELEKNQLVEEGMDHRTSGRKQQLPEMKPIASTSKKSVQHSDSQTREGLLKKREQELLRRYKADMVSGRSAEMCRRVRERWTRSSQKSTEDDIDTNTIDERPSYTFKEEYYQEMVAMNLWPQNPITPRRIKSLLLPPTSPRIILSRKSSLTMCEKDVVIAHQQLVDLRELQQQRRRRSVSMATPPQQHQPQQQQRRHRRRSRHVSNDNMVVESTSSSSAVVEAAGEETTASTASSSTLGDSKDPQEGMENPPQLCAGRICAVTTRPIPGYSHTFMLCSLANNNFTPINNVALYLDSEKNHLVPVPSEALTEPPRLADGHPLSAVFADIDFLGGDAVAQVMEQQPQHQLVHPNLEDSPEATAQLSNDDNDQQQQVEILNNIMSPLSQVNEMPVANVVDFDVAIGEGDEEDMTLHDDQMHTNILQLNVNGHRLELEPSMLFSIAEQPDSCIEVNVAETGGGSSAAGGDLGSGSSSDNGSATVCGRAVLHARDILRAAQVYLQERDLQLVNVEDLTLDEDEMTAAVPATDLLAEALAHSEVVDDSAYVVDESSNAGIGLLHIDTRTALNSVNSEDDVEQTVSNGGTNNPSGGMVFITHTLPSTAGHLTSPITARTNETNALLDQTPIMSTLENPSTARSVQLRRVVSPLTESNNLDDSLAVLGVTNGSSGVPTSLELPITVTNPAIAPRVVSAPTELVQVQFAPFQ